jgi:hypothetical protein
MVKPQFWHGHHRLAAKLFHLAFDSKLIKQRFCRAIFANLFRHPIFYQWHSKRNTPGEEDRNRPVVQTGERNRSPLLQKGAGRDCNPVSGAGNHITSHLFGQPSCSNCNWRNKPIKKDDGFNDKRQSGDSKANGRSENDTVHKNHGSRHNGNSENHGQ